MIGGFGTSQILAVERLNQFRKMRVGVWLKLKSLLKFGFVSTRYKDIFDFYYLINNESLSKDKLLKCFDTFIFSDETMKENNFIYN